MAKRSKGGGIRIIVKVKPKQPDAKLNKAFLKFSRHVVRTGREIGRESLAIIKRNTPVSTGRTRAAWRSNITQIKDGIEIRITNPLPQAGFLNRGTMPSIGRYVPDIGRRLRTQGMHPGIIGTRYIERSMGEIKVNSRRKVSGFARKLKVFIDSDMRGGK